MSLLSSILGPSPRASGNPNDERYWRATGDEGPIATSGVAVTAEGALMNPVVYACVHVISEDLGTSADEPGSGIYELLPSGGKRLVPNHPLDKILTFRPNRYQTAVEWIEMMIGHACIRGNAYSEIIPGPRGIADQLIPLHPDQVAVELNNGDGRGWVSAYMTTPGAAGQIRYVLTQVDGARRVLTDEEVFHLRGFSTGGVLGVSVIGMARNAIGLAMAMERHGARFFSNSARPGGLLTTKDKLHPDTIKRMQVSWRRSHGGVDNAHNVAVLEQGLTWQQLGMTSEDAQFLQSRQFQVPEIARFFRMPLHKIQDLTRSTNNNIEHQGIEYVTDTIRPWAVRFQQAVRRDLIVAEDKYVFKFDLERLRQGDLKSQLDAYAVGRQWGFFSPNEVREKLQMNPRDDEGADEYLTPMNMVDSSKPEPRLPPATSPPPLDEDIPGDEPAPRPRRDRAQAIVQSAALQVIRKELLWVRTWAPRFAHNPAGWKGKVSTFYEKHATLVAERLRIGQPAAKSYCDSQAGNLLTNGIAAAMAWENESVEILVGLALKEEAA